MDVVAVELEAVLHEVVDVGRLHLAVVVVVLHVAPSQVVGEDEKDVGWRSRPRDVTVY